jgi:hypothetical protein
MLLENIYCTDVTCYNHEILIVQATGVWNWHTFSVAPFIFYDYLKNALLHFRQMRVLEHHLLSSIMLLESSITLLENIYSTDVTHFDCEMLIVQATGVWHWHTYSVAPFTFYYYLKNALFYFRQIRVFEYH